MMSPNAKNNKQKHNREARRRKAQKATVDKMAENLNPLLSICFWV